MKTKEGYPGIDIFRMVCAVLVITIHTSPLQSINGTADFLLTRILARIGVPFFFLTSGFFLISRYARNGEPLKRFVRRTAVLYGLSTVLYFPVSLYNGSFRLDLELIKDVLFDGTFYHLWYFSASIMGAGIAWLLVRKWDYKIALPVSVFLYLIGLFGDSYYGISVKLPGASYFYQFLFRFMDYTRNGIFFAPLFFVLGGFLADSDKRPSAKGSMIAVTAGFPLLSAEAFILRHFQLQRHDSMYFFLPATVFFLFAFLLHWKKERHNGLKAVSRNLYILHPMMILAVRFLAKLLGTEQLYISRLGVGIRMVSLMKMTDARELLVENSLVHFGVVLLLSLGGSILLYRMEEGIKGKKPPADMETGRGSIEVRLSHLEHNVKEIEKVLPVGCRMMAVVKGNAYGHGEYETAIYLERKGVEAFAVATIDEGIRLRKYGIRGEILILGYTEPSRAKELRRYRLIQTVIDYAYGKALEAQEIPVKVHLKIDTGMHRLGMDWRALNEVKEFYGSGRIRVCGIYTHLCCADSRRDEDVDFSLLQIKRFQRLLSELKEAGIEPKGIHIQSSYGVLNYSELACDYARVGILLYGVDSTPGMDTAFKPDLKPVLTLKSKVVLLRDVPAGETVGYDRRFIAKRDTRVAVIPIGYRDGIPRELSLNRGGIFIKGKYAPIIGLVCMDQLMADVTEIDDVTVGEGVSFIGEDSAISAPAVAEQAGSISNELLSRLGERMPIRMV